MGLPVFVLRFDRQLLDIMLEIPAIRPSFFASDPSECFKPKSMRLLSGYCSTSCISASIGRARNIWLMAVDDRDGLGMGPNTNKVAHKPSEPTVAFVTKTAIFKHSCSVMIFSTSVLIFSKAELSWEWYLSNLPMAPGFLLVPHIS